MCGEYSHLACSGLPTYHIVHYFHSRIRHTCAECVRQKKCSSVDIDYDAEFANVEKLVQLEIERKKKVVDLSDRRVSISSNSSDRPHDVSETMISNISNESEDEVISPVRHHQDGKEKGYTTQNTKARGGETQAEKRKICFFYKQNRCNFGRSGQGCKYPHPRVCARYKSHGLDPSKGCETGGTCRSYHPPICRGSDKKRECFNLQCPRLHLKGTRRYPKTSSPIPIQRKYDSRPEIYDCHSHYGPTTGLPNRGVRQEEMFVPPLLQPSTHHHQRLHQQQPPRTNVSRFNRPPPPQYCSNTSDNPVNFSNAQIDQLEMLIGNLLKKIPWERCTGMEGALFSPVHCPHGQRN